MEEPAKKAMAMAVPLPTYDRAPVPEKDENDRTVRRTIGFRAPQLPLPACLKEDDGEDAERLREGRAPTAR